MQSFLYIFFLLAGTWFANKTLAQKSIDGLLQVEKAFAAESLKNGVRKSFQLFMDSTAIEFENGRPVNSRQLWAGRPDGSAVLKWAPQYAEIATSDDFGYTTGPWTFQQTKEAAITGRGQYTTVWQVNEKGEWKFLIDVGTGYSLINTMDTAQKINAAKLKHGTPASLLEAEKAFVGLSLQNSPEAYQKFLSAQSILNHAGALPSLLKIDQEKIIQQLPPTSIYKMVGYSIAPSGDLAYVYGTRTVNEKNTGYLRIWRHENGGWKIAVDVLQ